MFSLKNEVRKLSKNEKQRFNISAIDISNPNVQKIRYCKNVSYNHGLHDYANLYFNPRNPMMYYLIHHNNVSDLCVICVDKRVLDLRGTFVSDRNAASQFAIIETPNIALKHIDFKNIFAGSWISENSIEQYNIKQIQCAEVLVLNKVPVDYLVGVIVCNGQAKEKIEALGLGIKVLIRKKIFFQ